MTFPLHSPDFYAGDPYPAFRELRASAPVCWNDVTGFWALLKYEDIRFVSANPALFSSAKGISIPDPAVPNPVLEGKSDLHRPATAPPAAQADHVRIHPAPGAIARAEAARLRAAGPLRG